MPKLMHMQLNSPLDQGVQHVLRPDQFEQAQMQRPSPMEVNAPEALGPSNACSWPKPMPACLLQRIGEGRAETKALGSVWVLHI